MNVKNLIKITITASIYTALVWSLAPISFGQIQIRVANALIGLVPIMGMPAVLGITLGVLLGNIMSPLGPIDLLSVIPTFISLMILLKLKRVLLGLTIYSIILSAWVGFLLNYTFGIPFIIVFPYLLIGIGIATIGLGYLLYLVAKRLKL